ncbi:MAG: alpha-amylase family glycosyl hydrolase [Candidatus Rifleibacteriota bacterium]
MRNKFTDREKNWKNGAIVYQVFVDRFAPSPVLERKKRLFEKPLRLMNWKKAPERGNYNEDAGAWQHELDFWGGDLRGLEEKLDYFKRFFVDVIYLNPIFKSLTNHKYDTHDYFSVDPALGSNEDFKSFVDSAHRSGYKVVLDGVFNHVGRQSEIFKKAISGNDENARKLFRFKGSEPVCWNNVYNLPELDLGRKPAQDYIFAGKNSVVKYWLREFDIDGWRLDVAYEFGQKILSRITEATREVKPEATVIGEIWNYPEPWYPAVDGVINLHARAILLRMLNHTVSPDDAMQMFARMIDDCGIDHILQTWLTLDNHDTPRLASVVKSEKLQILARVLQFTLPGAVGLYYGSEFALKGTTDPEQRGTLPWHRLNKPPAIFHMHEKLAGIRKNSRALRIGDFRMISGNQTFSFMRMTEKVGETTIICANPAPEKKSVALQLRDGRIHDYTLFVDQLSGRQFMAHSGFIDVEVAAESGLILQPVLPDPANGYTRYKNLD